MRVIPWNPSTSVIDWRQSHVIAPERVAIFSRDPLQSYRYLLTRTWDYQRPQLAVIGLNPSTATEIVDDPTIRRLTSFARDNAYGGLLMLNLFAYRATDPREMKRARDPIGPLNDEAIAACCGTYDTLCAWGVHGHHLDRDRRVTQHLRDLGARLLCLGQTSSGAPKHPLYLAKTTPLTPFV